MNLKLGILLAIIVLFANAAWFDLLRTLKSVKVQLKKWFE